MIPNIYKTFVYKIKREHYGNSMNMITMYFELTSDKIHQ